MVPIPAAQDNNLCQYDRRQHVAHVRRGNWQFVSAVSSTCRQ